MIDDWDAAIEVLSVAGSQCGRIGRLWIERATGHLVERGDRALRAGLPPRVTTEDQFRAVLRGIAADVADFAASLEMAAAQLREAGKGYWAGQVRMAALRAKDVATGLGGGDGVG